MTQANIMDLSSYHWPGNIRELENAIERAIILSRSGSLDFSHVRPTDQSPQHVPISGNPDSERSAGTGKVLTENELKQMERQNTINALTACRWKIYGHDGAARMLTINPTTLIERMKRMRIRKPPNLTRAPH